MESPEHNHRLDLHVWQDCITTQSTLGSDFKPGTLQFCSAAEELYDRQVHALQLQITDAGAIIRCL